MGRERSDLYNFDDSSRPGPRTSIDNGVPPATGSSKASTRSTKSTGAGRGRNAHAHRVPRNRRAQDTGCRNPQVRKGIASIVFMMGIPCAIAGVILTIVVSTDNGEEGKKYPASFSAVGPILLAVSVVCFLVGVLLYNVAILKGIRDSFNLSDKDSFCRRHFPRLSAFIKPDQTASLNQAALNNLKTVPARSAMRKMPNPDLVTVETEVTDQGPEGQGRGEGQDDLYGQHHPRQPGSDDDAHLQLHHTGHHHYHRRHPPPPVPHPHHHAHLPPRRKRAVTFSQGDGDNYADDDGVEGRFLRNSTSSEPDRFSLHSDLGGGRGGLGTDGLQGQTAASSLLSLRHCKIYPKDQEVFWTDTSANGGGGGGGDGGASDNSRSSSDSSGAGAGTGGGHPAATDISVDDNNGDHDLAASGIGGTKVSLDDIDEERA